MMHRRNTGIINGAGRDEATSGGRDIALGVLVCRADRRAGAVARATDRWR
jgi:hypothetical protein